MDWAGRRVVIVGMGRSGIAAAKLLQRHRALPFVTESKAAADVASSCCELDALGIPYETGGHSSESFARAEVVVMSPGVPADLPVMRQSLQPDVPVLAELELASRFSRARIFAVTGTNGKTTTTELLRAMIAACGHSVTLAGNNATAFSTAVLETPTTFAVLEVSSYQLELVEEFRPSVAAILNLTPDHLSRHQSMRRYGETKARIFARQSEGDAAILNADDSNVAELPVPPGVRRCLFSQRRQVSDGLWFDGSVIRDGQRAIIGRDEIPLPGAHNLENVLCALSMARVGGLDQSSVLEGLRAFRGVEHRIEFVIESGGVRVYNDSKSTNIDSLRVALESFDQPIVLIAGGRGKGADYGVLRPLVQRRVKTLVTLGEDASKLEASFGDLLPPLRATDMEDAVARAMDAAVAGDVVLLSPACASFDMYANFEERGRHFKRCVLEHVPTVASEEAAQ